MYHKSGRYHQQAHLLHLISQNDGANQRDLAEQMDVRPSSMTEML
jgi:DNA-binding MarR family transcriptional regulator